MGGRGASSGISDSEKVYGTEYTTLHQSGNIKFVKRNEGSTTAPLETMIKGRIYATVDKENEIKYISFYDQNNKRYKTIEVKGRPHRGIKTPHIHYGYEHQEYDPKQSKLIPTNKDISIIDKVKKAWYNR